MKRKLFQKDLADALNISPSMVTRLKQQGMPTNSVAAAKRWREINLDPVLVKESRGIFYPGAEKFSEMTAASSSLNLIHQLGNLAEKDFEKWQQDLRSAMRLLPPHLREAVALPMPVWEMLTAKFCQRIKAIEAADPDLGAVPEESVARAEPMTDDDCDYMGTFWYGVAIGTVRINEN